MVCPPYIWLKQQKQETTVKKPLATKVPLLTKQVRLLISGLKNVPENHLNSRRHKINIIKIILEIPRTPSKI